MISDDTIFTKNLTSAPSPYRRPTMGNVQALLRYLRLRAQYPNLHTSLFYVGSGCDICIEPEARVEMGHNVVFRRDVSIHIHEEACIGNNVFFNRGCTLVAVRNLSIGDDSIFGEYVSIHDENHTFNGAFNQRHWVTAVPIVIGSNVWVGAKATILQGVHIGDGAVIGANSVVTHDVAPRTIVVGAPARPVRSS